MSPLQSPPVRPAYASPNRTAEDLAKAVVPFRVAHMPRMRHQLHIADPVFNWGFASVSDDEITDATIDAIVTAAEAFYTACTVRITYHTSDGRVDRGLAFVSEDHPGYIWSASLGTLAQWFSADGGQDEREAVDYMVRVANDLLPRGAKVGAPVYAPAWSRGYDRAGVHTAWFALNVDFDVLPLRAFRGEVLKAPGRRPCPPERP